MGEHKPLPLNGGADSTMVLTKMPTGLMIFPETLKLRPEDILLSDCELVVSAERSDTLEAIRARFIFSITFEDGLLTVWKLTTDMWVRWR